jgi:hypothetical protein
MFILTLKDKDTKNKNCAKISNLEVNDLIGGKIIQNE